MSWITDKLLGIRRVISGVETLPERGTLEFAGDGVTVADDTTNKRTVVTVAGATAEGVVAPTADTLLLRGSAGQGRVTRVELADARILPGDPTQAGDLGFTTTVRRPQAWHPGTGSREAILLRSDVTRSASYDHEAETGLATQTYSRVLSAPMLLPMRLVRAVLYPYDDLLANVVDFAEIRLSRVLSGSPTTLATVSNSADNWGVESPILFTVSDDEIPGGSYLKVDIAKFNAGVLLPRIAVFFEWAIDPDYVFPS